MIRLWSFDIDYISEDKARSIITNDEYLRAKRLRYRKDQNRSILGRAGIRLALSEQFSADPRIFRLSLDENRPPMVLNVGSTYLSLSHSGEKFLVGVSNQPIGVDIESILPLPELNDLEQLVLHPKERAKGGLISDADKLSDFYFYWAAKESYLKGLGVGLNRVLSDIFISTDGLMVNDPGEVSRWFVRKVDIHPQYMAVYSTQCEKHDLEIRYFAEESIAEKIS